MSGDTSDSEHNPLIQLAKSKAQSDPLAAKAWLLTARAVCPDNFNVQFEGYNVEKVSGNVSEGSRCLSNLLNKYKNEKRLQSELMKTVDAAYLDLGGFYNAMFKALSKEIQYKLILTVAELKSSIEEHCKLMVYAISNYPSLCQTDAVALVEKLLKHIDISRSGKIRALLVCQIIPLVFDLDNIVISSDLIRKILGTALLFYLGTTKNHGDGEGERSESEWLGVAVSGGVCEVWERVSRLLAGVDRCRHWAIHDRVSGLKNRGQLEYLVKACKEQAKSPDQLQAIFYYLLVLLLKSVYEYMSITRPDLIHDNPALQSDLSLTMVEVMVDYNLGETGKKRKLSQEKPVTIDLTVSDSCLSSDTVATSLELSVECWQVIQEHNVLGQEFQRVSSELRFTQLDWFNFFQLDLHMYKLHYPNCVQLLLSQLQQVEVADMNRHRLNLQRIHLQIAVACFHLEKFQDMYQHLLLVLESLNPQLIQSSTTSFTTLLLNKKADDNTGVHHLHLLALTDAELLHYIVHLILNRLKSLLSSTDDHILGHILILSQLCWPSYVSHFNQIITIIQSKSTFTYNRFFDYIIVPNILEEFCYLKTAKGGRVELDVMPVATAEATKGRTMTRGANREVREDFKVSMEKQVGRYKENVEVLVWAFLRDIIQYDINII